MRSMWSRRFVIGVVPIALMIGGASAAAVTVERVYLPERAKQTQLFEGNPKEAAAKLVEKLKFEARVI